ncbi:MAG: hypothetical protein H6738_07845 [Alphaproteobacteria bacterium]|nr:hypothetical protein [Alphaproteobacteria bacterium]MCB9696678.1 hypothetical protein [Alphaproteobacteria bacterium]
MWATLLVACGGDAFTGHLTSFTGTPLASVPVRAGRAEAQTDSEGAFSLPPAKEAVFTFGGVGWRMPATSGAHELRLPILREVVVRCPSDAACDLRLTWPEQGGLTPVVEAACEPGRDLELQAPKTAPEARCVSPDRELVPDDRDQRIELWPSGREIDIRLASADGSELPADCATWVDGVRATPSGPGRWSGNGRGAVWVGGQCGDRPIAPVHVARDGIDAALRWSPEGPDLDLREAAPWANRLVLTTEEGMSVLVRPSADLFHLPAMPPGDYRVEITGETPVWGSTVWLPRPEGDGMWLTNGGDRVQVGIWRVPEHLPAGLVPVR